MTLTTAAGALPIIAHPAYAAQGLPTGHRFPMGKFARLAEVLAERGLVRPGGFYQPIPAPASWLTLVHDPAYVDAVLGCTLDAKLARRIGFPMLDSVARRSAAAVGGTVLAARLALEHGAAANTAGGSHHADAAGGAGYCVFNDVAVAARVLLAEGVVRSVLVIDLDVHQGDGTARIFADDPRVFTFSMHCKDNWPHRKAQSDWDAGLPAGARDALYAQALDAALPVLLAREPDIVFYNAGVDIHAEDRLGLLKISDEGLHARDQRVAQACIAAGAPVVGVLGGGYAHDVETVAQRHASLHTALTQALSGDALTFSWTCPTSVARPAPAAARA